MRVLWKKLPVDKFFGVGKVTALKMKNMGLHTGQDLKKLTEDELSKSFGKVGRFYYQIVRGIDNREVQPNRETKSLGAEDTFSYDLTTLEEMEAELDKIAQVVCTRLLHYQLRGRTVTLKIKYNDFKQITRNQSFNSGISDFALISSTAKRLLAVSGIEDKKIRLLGISLSNFGEIAIKMKEKKQTDQLKLFPF